MYKFVILLFAFQLKHFLADFLFETEYMLGKFKLKGWIAPLSMHCYVHALFTLVIALIVGWRNLSPSYCLLLSTIDFILHFLIDRIKASPSLFGKYDCLSKYECSKLRHLEYHRELLISKKESNWLFWVGFGISQMLHQISYYFIIYLILH